jgi:hypothetical protein
VEPRQFEVICCGRLQSETNFRQFNDSKYEPSLARIVRQAEGMGVYDSIWSFRERDLKPKFYEFDYPAIDGEPCPSPLLDAYLICAVRDKKYSWRYRVRCKIRSLVGLLTARGRRSGR